jgi:hypothetical protein
MLTDSQIRATSAVRHAESKLCDHLKLNVAHARALPRRHQCFGCALSAPIAMKTTARKMGTPHSVPRSAFCDAWTEQSRLPLFPLAHGHFRGGSFLFFYLLMKYLDREVVE